MLRFAANSLHEEAKFKIITQLVPLFIGLSNRSDIGVAAISPRATTATLRTTCRNRPAKLPNQPVSLQLNPDALEGEHPWICANSKN
jgi:hypothetical protein